VSLRSELFAVTYDRLTAKVEKAELRERRSGLLARAHDRVLEIGAGTGVNLAHYGPAVAALTLTEPQPPMLRRLERRVREQSCVAKVLRAPAEDLPFDNASFDVAVSTLVLCGVSDQQRALRELHRVLRPSGELLFIEHVRSDDPKMARLQDRVNGVNRFLAGCECNRPTSDSIRAAGFDVTTAEHVLAQKMPRFVRLLVIGVAIAIPGQRFARPQQATRQQPIPN
jgi:ubiquinone/menaquinone biosynthesis C-methylase UbiE